MSAPPLPLFPATFQQEFPLPDKIDSELPSESYFVNLDEWVEKAKTGNILVSGWPHNFNFFEPYRDWLVEDVAPKLGEYTVSDSKDIVLHIRWGDYFESNWGLEQFQYPPSAFLILLGSLEYERCMIVTDTPGNRFASEVIKNHRGVLVSRDVDHDYRTLYHASRLIMSPSTFSWWAAWSGKANEIYQPYEMGFWKKHKKFALDLPWRHVRRFDEHGQIFQPLHS